LEQNYPNPFNPSTTIEFNLAEDSKVSLEIFNTLGEEVAKLVNENMVRGNKIIKYDASDLSSGVYLYKLTARSTRGDIFTSVKKMILIK